MMDTTGLLGLIMQQLQLKGVKSQPRVEGNVIVIDLTEEEVKNIAFKDADERFRRIADVKIVDGKLRITIKLF